MAFFVRTRMRKDVFSMTRRSTCSVRPCCTWSGLKPSVSMENTSVRPRPKSLLFLSSCAWSFSSTSGHTIVRAGS